MRRRRWSAILAAFCVVVGAAVPFYSTQAEALPNGQACGTTTTYDWGTQTAGSTPIAFTQSGVRVTPTLISKPGSSAYRIATTTQGADTGYVYFDHDGGPDGQSTVWELSFSEALYDLEVPLLDVDYGSWTDIVEIRAWNGTTEVTSSISPTVLGSAAVQTGTNPMTFRGVASSAPTSTDGNVLLALPGPVTRIRMTYIDGPGSGSQILGVGDLQFCAPQIGLAKRVVSGPTHNGDGTYTVTYRFVVENLGGTTLHDVQVADELATSFGTYVSSAPTTAGTYSVGPRTFVTNSATPLAFSSGYTGSGGNTNLLDPAVGSLAIGGLVVFDLPVTFHPDLTGGTATRTNAATALADSALVADGVTAGNTSDVSDDGADPDPNGNGNPRDAGEGDPTVFTVTAEPSVGLTKTFTGWTDVDASGATSVGDRAGYQLQVSNTGNVVLTGVSISDPTAGPVTCPASTLTPGASMTCTAARTLTQADLDAGVVNNTATVTATGGGSTVSATGSAAAPVPQISSIALVKSLITDTSGLVPGSTLAYQFTVTNTGTVTLSSVAVTDPLTGPVTCPATVLASAASMTCSATYTVTQADLDSGSIANTASVDGTDPNGAVRSDTDDELALLEQIASIDVDKPAPDVGDNDTSGTISLGDSLAYSILVTNTGNVTVSSLVVDDSLTGPVSCGTSALAPGASTTCVATLAVTQVHVDAGVVENLATATARTDGGTEVSGSDPETTPVPQVPAMTLDKQLASSDDVDGSGSVTAGDILSYRFTVVNTGNTTLTGVSVDDPKIGAVTCPATTLAPGASQVCDADYTVSQADVDGGDISNTATASGTDPMGGTVSDTSTEVVASDQTPGIMVDKQFVSSSDVDASGDFSPGDTISYDLTVSNTGTVTMSSISLTDSLTGAVGCPADSLAPGSSMTCAVVYTVTQTDIDNGAVDNLADVTAVDPGGETHSDTDAETVTVPRIGGVAIDKSLSGNSDTDGSGDVTFGDLLTYDFVVTNTGNVTLSAIVVDDPTAGPVSCPSDTVLPGAAMTCTASLGVTQAMIDSGWIVNVASVSALGPDGVEHTAGDTETVAPAQNPSISVTKTLDSIDDVDGSGTPSDGDVLHYVIDVINDGDVTLSSISVTDSITGSVSCPAVTLAPDGSTQCTVDVVLDQVAIDAGGVTNVADVSAERPGGDPGDPADDVVDSDAEDYVVAPVPSLTIDKLFTGYDDSNGNGDPDLGDVLRFSVMVVNTGNVTLDPVTITDPTADTLTCDVTALAPGATATCIAAVNVELADADAGQVTNTASATGTDPNGTEVDVEDQVVTPLVQSPAVTIDKTLAGNIDEDGSGDVTLGDTLDYEFEVTNSGNVTLSSLALDDPTVGAVDCGAVSSLAPGESVTCTASYTVLQADVDRGEIVNVAIVTSASPAGDVADSDTVTTPVSRNYGLDVVKTMTGVDDTDASGGVTPGDIASYAFAVTNTGTVTLDELQILDAVTGTVTCPDTTLAPDETVTCTAAYTIAQADIDAGRIDNAATALATDPDDNLASGVDSITTPLLQEPSLDLAKTFVGFGDLDASGTTNVGDSANYAFEVTNTGNVTLTNLSISDPLIAGVDCGAATTLAPGASVTCTGSYALTAAEVDAGVVDNTATAEANDPSGATISSSDSASASITRLASVQLTKSLTSIDDTNVSGAVDAGDTMNYEIEVLNTGNVTLTNAVVSDPLAGAVDCGGVMSLPAGSSLTCTAAHSIEQGDIDAGEVVNTATVVADEPAGGTVTDTDTVTSPIPQFAAIQIVKALSSVDDTNASGRLDAGDTHVYTLAVTNTGTVTLSAIAVSDSLTGPADCGGVTVLAPGNSVACSAGYVLSQADIDAGSVTNTATATAEDPDGGTVADADTIVSPAPGTPSIQIVKSLSGIADTDSSGSDTAGDLASYSFVVTNTGTVTLTTVAVADPLTGPVDCGGRTGLAPGESMTCAAGYALEQADVDAGVVRNTVDVAADDPSAGPVADSDMVSTPLTRTPEMAIVKTHTATRDTDGSGTDTVGDVFEYELVVTNTGNVTLTGLALSDPLVGAVDCGGVTTLAPAGILTCTAAYVLTQGDIDDGQVVNTATADAVGADGTPLSRTDDATSPIVQVPGLRVVKSLSGATDSDGSGTDTAGDVFSYEFDVTNTGNVTLSNLVVDDVLTGPVDCGGVTSLAPGARVTCTADHALTQSEVDAGEVENTATASAEDPNGEPVSDQDTIVTPVSAGPVVFIVKRLASVTDVDGSGSDTVGDIYGYGFEVTNTGNVTLGSIALVDPKVGSVSCPDDTLAPGVTMACSADYALDQDDIDAGEVLNTAAVFGTDPGGTVVSDADGITTPLDQVASLQVVKSLDAIGDVDASGGVAAGDLMTFGFLVTNTGNVTLDNLMVDDPLTGAVVCAGDNALLPGETRVCSAGYTLTQADIDSGVVRNTVTATADDPSSNVIADDDTLLSSIVQEPSVSVQKTLAGSTDVDASADWTPGDVFSYEFEVTNTGNVTLSNLVVGDVLTGPVDCGGVITLAPGAGVTCTADYTLTQGDVDAGEVQNTVDVTAEAPDGTPATDSDTVTSPVSGDPSISVVKSLAGSTDADGSGNVTAGDVFSYGFVVSNTGNVTLDSLVVDDPLTGPVDCGGVATLTPGAIVTCTADYVLTQTDVDAGEVENTVDVSAEDPSGAPVSDSDSVTSPLADEPSIDVVKTLGSNADGDLSGEVSLGDVLTYEFDVTNTGNVTLSNLVLDDPLTAAVDCGGVTMLNPGETVTCSADYTVGQGDVDAGHVLNTVRATADDPGATEVSDTDELILAIGSDPAIELVKSVDAVDDTNGSGRDDAGDTIDYRFVVTNTGNVTLTGITIDDPMIGTVSCPGSPLAPGSSMDCFGSHPLTQADVDAGEVTNTARVEGTSPSGTPVTDTDSHVEILGTESVIGLAKSVGSVDSLGDGRFHIEFVLRVENLGSTTISDIVVTDEVASLFAAHAPSGFAATSGTLTASGGWDGTSGSNIVSAGQSLAPGEIGTVVIGFVVAPTLPGPVDNQASVTGTDPSSSPVADLSTDGVDPDPDGDGVPSEQQPTPVSFAGSGQIDLVKRVVDVTGGRPTFTVTYLLTMENTGDLGITQLSLREDLRSTFGALPFRVVGVTSATLDLNPAYDGRANNEMLANGNALLVGGAASVRLTVEVAPADEEGPFVNQAIVSGVDQFGGPVSDLSSDGVTSEPDPTEVTFDPVGSISGRVTVDTNGNGVVESDEPALSGVGVRLYDGTGALVTEVATDEHGRYLFEDLPPGTYTIRVDVTGLGDYTITLDPDGVGDGATSVDVGPDQDVIGVDWALAPEAILDITKRAEEPDGRDIRWHVVVSNPGASTVNGPIRVTDDMPPGLTLIDLEAPTGWECESSGRSFECVFAGSFESGDSAAFVIDSRAQSTGRYENVATVSWTGPGGNSVTAEAAAAAQISPTALPFTGANSIRDALIGLIMLLLGLIGLRASRRSPTDEYRKDPAS